MEFRTEETLERTSCSACGIIFALPKDFLDVRRKDPTLIFNCPNGHKLSWPKSKTYDQLLKEVEVATARIKDLQQDNIGLRSKVDQLEAKLAEAGLLVDPGSPDSES